MDTKRIQLLLTGVAAWISLLLMITTTYGAGIVIGGNYADIGTIVIVTPKPGDPPANGTALLNTLAGICAIADVNNRYLIKLGPGIYDIGASSLWMCKYVDVEGSGESTTTITGHIDGDVSGVVQGASFAEIRFLTVQNTGGGTYAVAIANSFASPKITNVTASASGATYPIGVVNSSSLSTMTNVKVTVLGGSMASAVVNANSSPTMTNVTASASEGTYNYGFYNIGVSSITMMNVTASASKGTYNYGVYNMDGTSGTIKINNSVIIGSTNTIYNPGPSITTLVGNTQLDGGPVFNIGLAILTCAGVYDENYTFYPNTCP